MDDAAAHAVVRAAAEARLVELGHAVVPLAAAALDGRFARATAVTGALHYELDVAGVPCALSVWDIGVTENPAIDDALDAEVTTLRAGGRPVAHIINVFDDVLTLRCELLAAPGAEPTAALDNEIRGTLQRFWEPPAIGRGLVARLKVPSSPGGSR